MEEPLTVLVLARDDKIGRLPEAPTEASVTLVRWLVSEWATRRHLVAVDLGTERLDAGST
jgi:hypothetical protein